MSDVTSKERLTEKLANLEATYKELEDRKNEFIEERKLADGKITAVVTEQTRLQGDYRAIKELLETIEVEATVGLTPEEAKTKKEPTKTIPTNGKKK